MGDRVSATATIGGLIETVAQAEALISALIEDAVCFDQEKLTTEEECQTVLRQAVEGGKILEVGDFEVNYGRFDALDSFFHANPGMWCSTSYGTGGDFTEGINTIINGEEIRCSTNDGLVMVELSELKAVVNGNNNDTIAYELTRIIARVEREAGKNLPPLTASPAVMAWLKIFGEKAA